MPNPQPQKEFPGWLVLVALVAAFWYFGAGETGKGKPSPKSIEGGLLVFVLEGQSPTVDQELALRDAIDVVVQSKLKGYRKLDDDLAEVQPLIKSAKEKFKIEPPIAAIQKDGDLIRAVPFKDSASVKELVK